MEISELKERIRKRRFLMDAFLYSASLRGGSDEKSVMKHAVTGYFLQSVILELLVKMLRELDLDKPAPFTHKLADLFDALNQETKDFLEAKFEAARERHRKQFSTIAEVEFPPLREVLANNAKIVPDFKYEAVGGRANSSADSAFCREIREYIDARVSRLNV